MILCGVIFGSQGCATIFSGSTDKVYFDSEPRDATFIIAGGIQGKTPITLEVPKSTTAVTFSKKGYESTTVAINRSFKAGFLVLDILLTPGYGLTGCLIDALTGDWNGLPSTVSGRLIKEETPQQ
jgi:hypothetical protein